MDSTIVTQSTLQPVQFALNEVASNLVAHANASMSKAHGFNMLTFAPHSIADSGGNDISVYYDDHGDVIGTNFMVFTLSDGVYYAPCNDSSLGGQPLNTGQAVNNAVTVVPTGKQISWITDIITPVVSTVDSVNNQILLGHALLAYWETHGTVLVFARTVTDSLGHVIGDHVVQFDFNNNVYLIPCTTRLGGMRQAPFNLALAQNPSKDIAKTSDGSYQIYVPLGDDAPFSGRYPSGFQIIASASGFSPITFAWYYFPQIGIGNSPAVPALTDPTWTLWPASGVNGSLFSGHYAGYKFSWTMVANILTITKLFPPDDAGFLTTWVKVVATNTVGSTTLLLRMVTSADYADP